MATRMHFGWNAFQHGESRFDGRGIYIELSWVVFLVSGLIAILIALLTVSYQAGKVGLISPAKTLRAE